MRWASVISTSPRFEDALEEAVEHLEESLAVAGPDLLLAFLSPHHQDSYARLPRALASRFSGVPIIGCSGAGVIGGGREIESGPALSLTAARLPGVELTPFHLDHAQIMEKRSAASWADTIGLDDISRIHLVLLADPFSSDPQQLVASLDGAFPEAVKVGGLASGGNEPGHHVLYAGEGVHASGAVGVALTGDITLDTIVAQGCRPIGTPMFVTRVQRNVIVRLDGRPPAELLQELHESLSPTDRALMRSSLFLGLAITDAQVYHQGDFLIRNIVGMDPQSGVLAVGALPRENQVVQFHVRDGKTSAQELDELVKRHAVAHGDRPAGALLFACRGRGRELYGESDHDGRVIKRHLGPLAIGGFFCNGEIGPIHGRTFVHGYTSSLALFRARGH